MFAGEKEHGRDGCSRRFRAGKPARPVGVRFAVDDSWRGFDFRDYCRSRWDMTQAEAMANAAARRLMRRIHSEAHRLKPQDSPLAAWRPRDCLPRRLPSTQRTAVEGGHIAADAEARALQPAKVPVRWRERVPNLISHHFAMCVVYLFRTSRPAASVSVHLRTYCDSLEIAGRSSPLHDQLGSGSLCAQAPFREA